MTLFNHPTDFLLEIRVVAARGRVVSRDKRRAGRSAEDLLHLVVAINEVPVVLALGILANLVADVLNLTTRDASPDHKKLATLCQVCLMMR